MSSLSADLYGKSINKGIGGLMSGLNTDDLVKQMSGATRNKINREFQSKQRLLYRQQSYREISSKLISLNNKYFSYSSGSKNNILSPTFFESYTYKSSSNYVNVTGKAENIQNFSIDNITSVATAASFASNKTVAPEEFSSEGLTQYTSTIAGGTMTIEYGNKSYNISIDKGFGNNANKGDVDVLLGGVVEELNKKLEDLKLSDDLKFELVDHLDAKKGIKINSSDVKLTAASSSILDSLNLEVGKIVQSTSEIKTDDLIKDTASILQNGSSFISFEFNGVLKTYNLPTADELSVLNPEGKLSEQIAIFLQDKFNKEFGSEKVTVDGSSGSLVFKSKNTTDIFGVSSISTELSNFTGIESGDYNRLNRNKSIKDLDLEGLESIETYKINVNGTEIDIENTMSVTDVINKINSNAQAGVRVFYSSTTNTFTVKAIDTGKHISVSIVDVDGGGNLAQTLFGTAGVNYEINNGTDTEIEYTLNGVTNKITRSTANFTIDEINIELNEKASSLDFTNPVTFDVTNNSDEVVEKVKEFINDYNEIISLISTKTSEKPKRGYPPLTPEQQEEMEESEIKNWNEEAKKGALFGDRKMNNVLRSMRESMSGFTDVSNLTLSSIGISSANMDTSGKLVLDEKKFKERLLENPDEIARLFTGTTSDSNGRSGIAIQLQLILRENVGAYGTTGFLIEEAGMENSMTSDRNYISEKMEAHDDRMAELRKSLEREQKRYWDQFSALEQSLNRLNAQSGWLTDMMGGGN